MNILFIDAGSGLATIVVGLVDAIRHRARAVRADDADLQRCIDEADLLVVDTALLLRSPDPGRQALAQALSRRPLPLLLVQVLPGAAFAAHEDMGTCGVDHGEDGALRMHCALHGLAMAQLAGLDAQAGDPADDAVPVTRFVFQGN